jgi:hypothetical protein
MELLIRGGLRHGMQAVRSDLGSRVRMRES